MMGTETPKLAPGLREQIERMEKEALEYEPPQEGSKEERGQHRSEGTDEAKAKQADRLVTLADDAELFHNPEGKPFASFSVGEHREVQPLRGRLFRSLLAKRFYENERKAPGGQAMADALAVLEGKALHDGSEEPVFVRLAGEGDRIYLDLGTPDWQVVEIGPAGWDLIPSSPVRFWRPSGLQSLPAPNPHGSIEDLRAFLNVADEDGWRLLIAWLLAALRPTGPYPLLILHGEQGSAKSTTARLLKLLVDPSAAPLRSEPRKPHDLMIAATRSWILAFDNLSRLGSEASDALCRLSTGGGFATRMLYTSDEEITFDAMRPVILNSIEEVAKRADLLDRALIVNLPRIAPEDRRTERAFWTEFEKARPRILGALLHAVSHGLRELPGTHLPRPPRLADFATWVSATEGALGWGSGKFLGSYDKARYSAGEVALDCAVGEGILNFLDGNKFEGTATELREEIEKRAGDSFARRKDWPTTPHGLSGAVKRLAPHLREKGYLVEFDRTGNRRIIVLTRPDGWEAS